MAGVRFIQQCPQLLVETQSKGEKQLTVDAELQRLLEVGEDRSRLRFAAGLTRKGKDHAAGPKK